MERKEAIIRAYKRLFDSDDGKVVLQDLAKSCNFSLSSFDSDPYRTAYNEGVRSVILRLFDILDTDLEIIIQLLKREKEMNYAPDF